MARSAIMESIQIGDIKVTYLPDGEILADPVAYFPASSNEEWNSHQSYLNRDGKLVLSVGAFLLEAEERKIAVDMGLGPYTEDIGDYGSLSGGDYLDSLRQTGVAPEEITDVVYTHLHVDHIGWTSQEQDGEKRLTFPNASYFMAAREWEHWYTGENAAAPHMRMIEERTAMVAGGDLIAPGVRVVFTSGHTPGHISLLISSGTERAYLIGDVLHSAVQVLEPDWRVRFDNNIAAAWRTREQLYGKLAQPNTITIAGHFSESVFGRISINGNERKWKPL